MGNKCLIILLILLSSSGLKAQFDIIWQRTMGGTSSDEVYDITTAPNGGIFLVGRTASSNFDIFGHHGGFDFFIAKLDSVGNTVWKKTLGGSNNETPYAVQYTADGGCLVLGSTKSNDQDIQNYHGGLSDGWLLRLDESGNIVWQKTLGGSEWDELYSMIALKEGN
ncbi:MAG: T9SS C-terminal target domain-containing protein, partial [Bacteroidota bacterium]